MIRKFLGGIVFGIGTGVALLIVYLVSVHLVLPRYLDSMLQDGNEIASLQSSDTLLVVRFEGRKGERQAAIIEQIHHKQEVPGFPFNIGDEYPSRSFTPRDDALHGSGAVVLISGPGMRPGFSANIYDGRVPGMQDMTVDQVIAAFYAGDDVATDITSMSSTTSSYTSSTSTYTFPVDAEERIILTALLDEESISYTDTELQGKPAIQWTAGSDISEQIVEIFLTMVEQVLNRRPRADVDPTCFDTTP